MPVRFKTTTFEGPLDLLLQLVEQERLPITEVSLAQVTDQYLEHLEHAPGIPKEELADFLVVATRLLYLKSRTLLPTIDLGLDEGGLTLEDQLRMYKAFADAAKRIDGAIRLRRFLFPREKPPLQQGMFSPPKGLTAGRLASVFREVLRAVEPIVQFPRAAVARAVSIKEKIAELHALLGAQREMTFHGWVRGARSRTEVVVSFLALLELVKQRMVRVEQDELFHDITIGTAGAPGTAAARA